MSRCRNCVHYRPLLKFRPHGYCYIQRCYKSLERERELKDDGIIEEKNTTS